MRLLIVLLLGVFSVSSYSTTYSPRIVSSNARSSKKLFAETKLLNAISGKPAEIRHIVRGLKINVNRHINGFPPLFYAVDDARSVEAIKELINAGANINARIWTTNPITGATKNIGTVLHRAVLGVFFYEHEYENQLNIIRALLKNGADPTIKSHNGHTPYMLAWGNMGFKATTNGIDNTNGPEKPELITLLRAGKTPSEIIYELSKAIRIADTELSKPENHTYEDQINREKRNLNRALMYEFATLLESAKNEQERQSLKALLNRYNRPGLLSQAMNKIRCLVPFSAKH